MADSTDLVTPSDPKPAPNWLGQPITLNLIAILTIYFIEGIVGLAHLSISFFLKDEIGLTPAQVAGLTGVAILPWTIKPLLGLISDAWPLFGYRRRSYLVLAGLLGTGAWLALATVVDTAIATLGMILLASLSIAFSDVIIDALIVERAQAETLSEVGRAQSLAFGSTALGGIASAYLGGLLLQVWGTRFVFGLTAIFPFIIVIVALLMDEPRREVQDQVQPLGNKLKQLHQTLGREVIWKPMAFIFLWCATPNSESAFFFFSTNELGFQPEFLGRVHLVVSLASLLGIWIFYRFLKTVPFRQMFAWGIVLSSLLGMTMLILVTHLNQTLGVSDQWFVIGDSLILTVVGKVAFMAVMVLSARLCPPGIEATLFAVLMSIFNLGHLVAKELGGVLTHWLGVTETNFEQLWLLVLLCNLSTLLPLLLLGWLPKADVQSEVASTQGDRMAMDPENELTESPTGRAIAPAVEAIAVDP